MSREQQILDAAATLISERGFDGVGVDAIGELAGVTGSAIYRHFDGKNEILAVLFDQAIDALLMRLSEPVDDPEADLRALVRSHVEFAAQHPRLAQIWMREQRSLSAPYLRALRRREQRYVDHWRACLDRRYPGRPTARTSSAMRAVHALLFSDATGPVGGRRAVDVDDLLVEMALRSLDAL